MTVLSIGEHRPASTERCRADEVPRDNSVRIPRDRGMTEMASGEDDRARFARIVLPHLADAYSLARWITGSRADAEDVVQDACLRAFRAIWSADVNPRAWMLTIVRNTAFTWLRKNRPAALVEVEDLEQVEHAQSSAGAID